MIITVAATITSRSEPGRCWQLTNIQLHRLWCARIRFARILDDCFAEKSNKTSRDTDASPMIAEAVTIFIDVKSRFGRYVIR